MRLGELVPRSATTGWSLMRGTIMTRPRNATASVPQHRPLGGGSPLRRAWWRSDEGATTAEFAIVTMAAVGFAGLLVVILQSDQVRAILEGLVQRALGAAG